MLKNSIVFKFSSRDQAIVFGLLLSLLGWLLSGKPKQCFDCATTYYGFVNDTTYLIWVPSAIAAVLASLIFLATFVRAKSWVSLVLTGVSLYVLFESVSTYKLIAN